MSVHYTCKHNISVTQVNSSHTQPCLPFSCIPALFTTASEPRPWPCLALSCLRPASLMFLKFSFCFDLSLGSWPWITLDTDTLILLADSGSQKPCFVSCFAYPFCSEICWFFGDQCTCSPPFIKLTFWLLLWLGVLCEPDVLYSLVETLGLASMCHERWEVTICIFQF